MMVNTLLVAILLVVLHIRALCWAYIHVLLNIFHTVPFLVARGRGGVTVNRDREVDRMRGSVCGRGGGSKCTENDLKVAR